MAEPSAVDRDEWLAGRARFAMLTTMRKDGSPTTIPVWFDWTGTEVEMFAGAGSSKLTRISRNPMTTVLVANEVDEPEFWVAFDGDATVEDSGGWPLAERLASRYWDLSDPQRAAALGDWRAAGDAAFRKIVLRPDTIRSYAFD